jgi:hypothetical protein
VAGMTTSQCCDLQALLHLPSWPLRKIFLSSSRSQTFRLRPSIGVCAVSASSLRCARSFVLIYDPVAGAFQVPPPSSPTH